MIARVWSCRVPRDRVDAAAAHILRTGVFDAGALDGYLGAQLLRRVDAAAVQARLTVITYWRGQEHLRAFAGDDMARPVLYPGDGYYGIQSDDDVVHWDVAHLEDRGFTDGGGFRDRCR